LSTKLGSWKHLLPTNASVADGLESEVNIIVSDCIPLFFCFRQSLEKFSSRGCNSVETKLDFCLGWNYRRARRRRRPRGQTASAESREPRRGSPRRRDTRLADQRAGEEAAAPTRLANLLCIHYLCTSRFAKLWSLQDVAAELVAS
jgi:hypothetical protein